MEGLCLCVTFPAALRLLQRNSFGEVKGAQKEFYNLEKSGIRFQTTVNTSEIVVRAVSFQIIP
jgi:hypothetical protein